jgi:hypothetical protein
MSPSDRVAQIYPQALGSLFVAFYDLQGCGGVILSNPPPHGGVKTITVHNIQMSLRCRHIAFTIKYISL